MDIWDWVRGLRRWWWIIILFPLLAAVLSWFTAPEPKYESRWTVNVVFNNPELANNPRYIDFIVLDDFDLLMKTSVLGDMIYLRLPQDIQVQLTRDDFGQMIDSSRKARFVEISVSGDDPELVRVAAETIEANSEEITNHYLVPPTYQLGAAHINTLDPISAPVLDTRPRTVFVGSVTAGVMLASVAATGVAEWLRISYRAKYSDK